MSGSYMRLSDISSEDLEDGAVDAQLRDGIIDDREIISYIKKYTTVTQGYHEFFTSVLQDIFFNPNLSTNRLFVENPVTGQFQIVESLEALSEVQKQQEQAQVDEDDKLLADAPPTVHLAPEERLDYTAKMLSIPPLPSSLLSRRRNAKRTINDEDVGESDENRSQEEWISVTMEYRNFAFVKRLLFLVFQGLLAGFCMVTIFFENTLSSDTDVFTYYQPFAQEVRRYLYLLATISLVGAFDYLLTSYSQYTTPSQNNAMLLGHLPLTSTIQEVSMLQEHQKTSLLAGLGIAVVYAICFLCTLVMSSFDVLCSMRNNKNTNISVDASTWATTASSDSEFTDKYSQWQQLNALRTATALLAWFACCLLLWRDISRFTQLWRYVRRVRQTAVLWMKRARLLQGQDHNNVLDAMTPEELQELLRAQEFGQQRVRMALSLMQMEQQQRIL